MRPALSKKLHPYNVQITRLKTRPRPLDAKEGITISQEKRMRSEGGSSESNRCLSKIKNKTSSG